MSICIFAYNCHNHIIPLYVELERRSVKRIKKIEFRSLLIMWTIYLVVSYCGYFSTYELTPKIVLLRESLYGKYIETSILVGIAFIVVLLIIHSPVTYFPARKLLI
jgi:amino acid permease